MNERKVLVSINLGNFGSTGSIMYGIADAAAGRGYETYQLFPRDTKQRVLKKNDIILCSDFIKKVCQRICRYTGFNGCAAYFTTKRMLRKIKALNPSVIQLHNLHNSYVNLPLLFRYFKKSGVPVVWTLHDCWSFTGQCAHFTFAQCNKWKQECGHCSQYKNYPEMAYDNTRTMHRLKQKWFSGIPNMTIVTPSQWLADLAKQSYLKQYPIQVINNGIDLSIFQPRESQLRDAYSIPKDKFVLLGVAFAWNERKGVDVFRTLSERLDPDKFQFVLVGVDEKVKETLSNRFICIGRTNNQIELAEIYSFADLFVNPTREENYPTVNMEAIACGTPVLTFRTGGSPEIPDEHSGSVVECGDIETMAEEIVRIAAERPFSTEDCLARAAAFDMNERYTEYMGLYQKLVFDS